MVIIYFQLPSPPLLVAQTGTSQEITNVYPPPVIRLGAPHRAPPLSLEEVQRRSWDVTTGRYDPSICLARTDFPNCDGPTGRVFSADCCAFMYINGIEDISANTPVYWQGWWYNVPRSIAKQGMCCTLDWITSRPCPEDAGDCEPVDPLPSKGIPLERESEVSPVSPYRMMFDTIYQYDTIYQIDTIIDTLYLTVTDTLQLPCSHCDTMQLRWQQLPAWEVSLLAHRASFARGDAPLTPVRWAGRLSYTHRVSKRFIANPCWGESLIIWAGVSQARMVFGEDPCDCITIPDQKTYKFQGGAEWRISLLDLQGQPGVIPSLGIGPQVRYQSITKLDRDDGLEDWGWGVFLSPEIRFVSTQYDQEASEKGLIGSISLWVRADIKLISNDKQLMPTYYTLGVSVGIR